MRKDTITELVVKYDQPCRVWILDAVFEFGSTEEIFAWSQGKDIQPEEQLNADLIGLTMLEARQVLVEKYGADPWPERVMFKDGMAHFEYANFVAATPDMLRAMPEMISALQASVRTLRQYRFLMEKYWINTTYPARHRRRGRGKELLDRICPGLDIWGRPLPKEDSHEQ